jgi:transposase
MIINTNLKYYVYGLFANDVCFYIGKGTGRRFKDHFRQYKSGCKMCNYMLWCKLKSLESLKIVPVSKILKDNLSESEALEIEKHYIDKFGKKLQGGSLCNISDGGNQPPTSIELKNSLPAEVYKEIRNKTVTNFKKAISTRNLKKIRIVEEMLAEGKMIKEIATFLNKTPVTISKWINLYKIPFNHEGKKRTIKNHLEKLSKKRHLNKIPISAKTYKVIEPDGSIISTQRLISYCKEKNIDYANLRRTFNKNTKHKGYQIIEVTESIKKAQANSCS